MINNLSIKVAPSLLACDFSNVREEIKKVEDLEVDFLHLDIMDGHFVPNISFGPPVIEKIRKVTKLKLEAHLMIELPGMYIEEFINAGVNMITVHAECYSSKVFDVKKIKEEPRWTEDIIVEKLLNDLKRIKVLGAESIVCLNPKTPVCIKGILNETDKLLVMSVNPGFGGQSFMPEILPKIKELRSMYDRDIIVDGGINDATGKLCKDAGANVLVAGTYIFGAKDIKKAVELLRK
ncbi:MAG: ribulose-phosphate 3-epimerase [bacterium]